MRYPAGITSNTVMVNGIKTHFVEAGRGEPVVLVHGAGPGANGWAGWRQTIPALAERYHVYAIDTLGFGYTDKPTDIVYTDQVSVDHLAGFIDVMCLDKVLLCGNSRGAYMTAKYTLDHPEKVKRLAMVSSGSLAAAMGLERRPDQMAGMKTMEGFDGTREGMRRSLEVIVFDHSKITDELIDGRMAIASLPGHSYVLKSQSAFRKSLKTDPNQHQLFDVRHRLPRLTIPMLMVWGAKDSFAPPEFAQAMEGMLPNVRFIQLENSGHQAQNDESERFNKLMLDFFGESGA